MATNRKRRTIVEETLDDKEGQDGGVDIADVIVVMSKVYRLNAGSKSFVTQTQEPVDEIFLQSNYPQGGKYIVYEYNTMNQQINAVNYEIEPKTIISSNGNSNGVGNGSVHDMQIRMLFEELNHSRQMVLTLITQLGQNKGGSVNELVTALASLHQISGGNQPGKDPVDLLIKGMELGANGGKVASDWKTELLSTIKDVAPAALGAIAANRQPALNAAPGAQPMIPQPQPTEEDVLKAYIRQIKSQVIGGLNPELAVEWITNNARDPDYQPLLRLAIHGTVDSFISLDTEIANEPFRTWFTSAITMIKEWYAGQQQVQTDDDLDGGTGNDSDVKHDATTSNRRTNVTKTV